MTDPSTPTLDSVEDRLRRTFAARAEDMAPGDADGALPDLGVDVRAGARGPAGPRTLCGRRPSWSSWP